MPLSGPGVCDALGAASSVPALPGGFWRRSRWSAVRIAMPRPTATTTASTAHSSSHAHHATYPPVVPQAPVVTPRHDQIMDGAHLPQNGSVRNYVRLRDDHERSARRLRVAGRPRGEPAERREISTAQAVGECGDLAQSRDRCRPQPAVGRVRVLVGDVDHSSHRSHPRVTPLHLAPGQTGASGRRRATDESACTPGSVHGCLAASRWAIIHLGLPLPAGSSGLPAGIGRAALERLRRTAANRRPFLTLLRVGFT
jgi:hypothetical protein